MAGARFHSREQAPAFLAELPSVVRRMSGCDVVLYQAGADPHVNDPLGGWLTTKELRRRDAIVFETLAALGVPVVWNLAGGYQREPDGSIPGVLEIHDNTMRECARVFCGPLDRPDDRRHRSSSRFRLIARGLATRFSAADASAQLLAEKFGQRDAAGEYRVSQSGRAEKLAELQ